ncbi:Spy/CpxP family protein refolding chaperone [Hydrogenovibrio kuenenii]|uniref:Spy/CpxP family protein refolding chaperone n=1 Tax=Hydrogenovibrio kuenenii TaxID=63658 RepID=UPI000463A0FC|nr:Spy/CpxP family protein refolding chaperone [Hydrogenovibrio kuenenii]
MKTIIKALLLTFTLSSPFTIAQADDHNYPPMGYGGMSMMGGGYSPGMMNGQGMGYGNGYHMRNGYAPGMMGGYGMSMMGGFGMGYGMRGQGMGMINLSDEQMKQMQKIRSDAMKDMQPIMRKMWKARTALWKAMRTDKRDYKMIGKAYDNLSARKKEAFVQRLKMQEKMRKVLTKEQKEELKDAYENMMMGN